MKMIVASNPDLANRLEILIGIPGISTTSAIALLADMPELGALTDKQAAALAGERADLAPVRPMAGARTDTRWHAFRPASAVHADALRDAAQPGSS
ncbi:hypothetical protein [Alloyangia pacifica]|uniref:hypothetical protein n=1 Tax=Alloyangia pacifica TaxID=311180 RepID=UPI001CD4CA65|nr:hypothetical protein [Alloyangia pacifica]MCA0997767.1 hypothetical protein [Alloyangia pacifica]